MSQNRVIAAPMPPGVEHYERTLRIPGLSL